MKTNILDDINAAVEYDAAQRSEKNAIKNMDRVGAIAAKLQMENQRLKMELIYARHERDKARGNDCHVKDCPGRTGEAGELKTMLIGEAD